MIPRVVAPCQTPLPRSSLHTEALETIEQWLAAQREIWESRLDRRELYVEKPKKEEKSKASK